jgi:NAD(P)-dependent dehydrogenase (short-subunit alcohol dehydrogenase family)
LQSNSASNTGYHRLGDIAGMVAWLVSDDARGVTGQALDMNGGAFMT